MEIFDDLVAEQARLDEILATLDDDAWSRPSSAEGWTVTDVVLHLAQTNEVVVGVAAGRDAASAFGGDAEDRARADALTLDEVMELKVRAERAPRPRCSPDGARRVGTRSPRCVRPIRNGHCPGRQHR